MDTQTTQILSVFSPRLQRRITALDGTEPHHGFNLAVMGMARFLVGQHDDDLAMQDQAARDSGQALDAPLQDPFVRASAAAIRFGVLLRADERGESGGEPGRLTQVLLRVWDDLEEDLGTWHETLGEAPSEEDAVVPVGAELAAIQLARAAAAGRGIGDRASRYAYAQRAAQVGDQVLRGGASATFRKHLASALHDLDMDTWRSREPVPVRGPTPHEWFRVRHPERGLTGAQPDIVEHGRKSPRSAVATVFGLELGAYDALVASVHEPTRALLAFCCEAWARDDARGGCLAVAARVGDSVEGPFTPRLAALATSLRAWGLCHRLTIGERLDADELAFLPQLLVVLVNDGQAWTWLGRPRERELGAGDEPGLPPVWSDAAVSGLLAAERCARPLGEDWALYLLVLTDFLLEEPGAAACFDGRLVLVLDRLQTLSRALAAPRAAEAVRARVAELRRRPEIRAALATGPIAAGPKATGGTALTANGPNTVQERAPVTQGCGCVLLGALLPVVGTASLLFNTWV